MRALTGFRKGPDGVDEIVVDPDAEKDFAIAWEDWLNGDLISTVAATISPAVTDVPYTVGRNESPETITLADGTSRTFPAYTLSKCWLKDLAGGTVYTVRHRITTGAGRVDDYSFRVICRER
jgi:hypothetical protein